MLCFSKPRLSCAFPPILSIYRAFHTQDIAFLVQIARKKRRFGAFARRKQRRVRAFRSGSGRYRVRARGLFDGDRDSFMLLTIVEAEHTCKRTTRTHISAPHAHVSAPHAHI
eukprot:545466-Rhodomonas_salina.1